MKANNTYNVVIANEACNFTATKYNTTLTGFTTVEDADNAAWQALRDIQDEIGYNKTEKRYNETLGVWVLYNPNNGAWLLTAKIEEVTDNTTPTTSDTMNTETKTMNEVIANTPANLSKLHALAAAETPMFYIWLDAVDDAATTSVYLTEAAARADIARLENDDKDAGVYEPDAYSIINAAPYFL